MYQLVVNQRGKRGSHADAVVGAESGAVSAQPLAVNYSSDGLIFEIKTLIVRLAHHIHMRLHNHSRSLLVTRSGSLGHNHVADSVGAHLDTVFGSEIEKELADFFLLL